VFALMIDSFSSVTGMLTYITEIFESFDISPSSTNFWKAFNLCCPSIILFVVSFKIQSQNYHIWNDEGIYACSVNDSFKIIETLNQHCKSYIYYVLKDTNNSSFFNNTKLGIKSIYENNRINLTKYGDTMPDGNWLKFEAQFDTLNINTCKYKLKEDVVRDKVLEYRDGVPWTIKHDVVLEKGEILDLELVEDEEKSDCPYCNIDIPLEKDEGHLLFKKHLENCREEEKPFPCGGEMFWFITSRGNVDDAIWDEDFEPTESLGLAIEYGNVFRSIQEAEHAAEKIKELLASLKK
jgi:hypothetical protein